MTAQKIIQVRDVKLSNENSFALVGGLNVLESESVALQVAETFRSITDKLRIPYIFKASFDKANRSSIDSFRGPGLDEGLQILEKIKSEFDVPSSLIFMSLIRRHRLQMSQTFCSFLPFCLVKPT